MFDLRAITFVPITLFWPISMSLVKQVTIRGVGSVISNVLMQSLNNETGSFTLLEVSSHCRFSTHERLSWASSSRAVLLQNVEAALESGRASEALASFIDFKKLYGFPEDSLVTHRLIAQLSYSSEPPSLRKAHNLVLLISRENPGLLHREILSKLCLSLARAHLTSPASEILGLMLKRNMLPPVSVLSSIVLHMVKTQPGTILASSFLFQLCKCFFRMTARDRDRASRMRPDTMLFNLVLNACARFGLGFRGERVVESMALVGAIADADSIVAISRIHEMNGRRDELKRFKPHIDRAILFSPKFVSSYRQFYDSLLNLHFKFNDIESVADLIREICQFEEPPPSGKNSKAFQKSFLVPIGSQNLRDGLKIEIQPEAIWKERILKADSNERELIMFRDGKLVLSNMAVAKLVKVFKRLGDVTVLSNLLLGIEKGSSSSRGHVLCVDVIGACIRLGWLEFSHDILDDIENRSDAHLGCGTYILLLAAYFRAKMLREAKVLLNRMRKPGMEIMLCDKLVIAEYLSGVDSSSVSTRKSDLVGAFVRETLDEKKAVPSIVYELNSSIHFFCKAKMIGDAMRTYRRMRDSKFGPTVETFGDMVSGFSSLEMYREITILWGDMKRDMGQGNLVVSRDLYEELLVCFLRGGYFERVMEVIDHMSKRGLVMDKLMYRSEFLKLHHNLYRKLKASEARTEVQRDRLRYVLAFRKWTGIE